MENSNYDNVIHNTTENIESLKDKIDIIANKISVLKSVIQTSTDEIEDYIDNKKESFEEYKQNIKDRSKQTTSKFHDYLVNKIPSLKEILALKELESKYNFQHVYNHKTLEEKQELCLIFNEIVETLHEFKKFNPQSPYYDNKKSELEYKIIKLLQNIPDLMYLQSKQRYQGNNMEGKPVYNDTLELISLAHILIEIGFDKTLDYINKDKFARIIQDEQGLNLGMLFIKHKKFNFVKESLDDDVASVQQNVADENIAIMLAKDKESPLQLLQYASQNEEACRQQATNGFNMAIYIAREQPLNRENMQIIVNALQDSVVRHQTDKLFKHDLYQHISSRLEKQGKTEALNALHEIYSQINKNSPENEPTEMEYY